MRTEVNSSKNYFSKHSFCILKYKDIILKRKHLAITFVDFLPALRQLAADALEKHLVQCRRQIATILSDRQGRFKNLF